MARFVVPVPVSRPLWTPWPYLITGIHMIHRPAVNAHGEPEPSSSREKDRATLMPCLCSDVRLGKQGRIAVRIHLVVGPCLPFLTR